MIGLPIRLFVCLLSLPFHWICDAAPVWAGSTSSEWVLVVNGRSEDSRTLANSYAHWRNIPARNIIVLTQVPTLDRITSDSFRDTILLPILKEIDDRKLGTHIQGIVYSCDFPTSVELPPAYVEPQKRMMYSSIGSITGLTFLYRSFLSDSPSAESLPSNSFACRSGEASLSKAVDQSAEPEWKDAISKLRNDDEPAARAIIEKLIEEEPFNYGLPYRAACEWATQGHEEQALDFLEQSVASGWPFRGHLAEDPQLTQLRDTSKFQFLRDLTPDHNFSIQPTKGFDARKAYSMGGYPSKHRERGLSYLLSCSLAVTNKNTFTLDEALESLHRSSHADWSYPKGTFYFSSDLINERELKPATEQLKKLGYDFETQVSDFPTNLADCAGLFGTWKGGWDKPESNSLPGSIVEVLLDKGGAMIQPKNINLHRCMRAGSAGSSGPVSETNLLNPRFPSPMLLAHYASGATLAESYYLSVLWPDQTLIIGDPLCQPFASPPRLEVEGLEENQVIDQEIVLSLKDPQKSLEHQPAKIRLLIDGQLHKETDFTEEIRILFDDPDSFPPGAHLLTMIVIDDSLIQNKWEWQQWFQTAADPKATAEVTIDDTKAAMSSGMATVRVIGPEGSTLRLMHGFEEIGSSTNSNAEFQITPMQVGRGPIELHAIATVGDKTLSSLPKTLNWPVR